MKVVILAGGLGTRLAEETIIRPKPMVEIGGKPILWHILKIYAQYGYNDFIICLGYKGNTIKEYFINYFYNNADIKVDTQTNTIETLNSNADNFKITLVDTGLETNTAGRIKKIEKYIDGDTFMLTYGDGVSDVNIPQLIDFHFLQNKLATLTAIQPPSRFGNIEMDENGHVKNFTEKPSDEGLWINGGFFVLNKKIFSYLKGEMDDVQWEKVPLAQIAQDGELVCYKHTGFWKCMDAIRDKTELEELWNSNNAHWKIW